MAVEMTAPNGATVMASDESADALLAAGFKRAKAKKPDTDAAPKRAAKPKE